MGSRKLQRVEVSNFLSFTIQVNWSLFIIYPPFISLQNSCKGNCEPLSDINFARFSIHTPTNLGYDRLAFRIIFGPLGIKKVHRYLSIRLETKFKLCFYNPSGFCT